MNPIKFYYKAKQELLNSGFDSEIEWQSNQSPENISESYFLQEAAWVIYCSGFREATVRKTFDFISLCFCDWESAKEISEHRNICILSAMLAFHNKRKHDAVADVAEIILQRGFCRFKEQLLVHPIDVLKELPFIGNVTSCHLAKNLGFNVSKPDRHLLYLKEYFGYNSVEHLCEDISSATGDAVKVVDIILWRYIEQKMICKTNN